MQDAVTDEKPRVAYLGPPASFSHQAARESFLGSASASLHPLPSFASILSAVQTSTADSSIQQPYDYALIPVENSTNGGVVQVLDLLIQCGLDPTSCRYPDVEVVAEHYLEVHHCLFVHPSILEASSPSTQDNHDDPKSQDDLIAGLNITMLYTHPQVWGQCNNFLSKHFPTSQTERIDMSSTSAAAVFVAKNPPQSHTASNQKEAEVSPPTDKVVTVNAIAAISSSLAGAQNKLACLAENIEDEPGKNTTRFLIIRNRNHRERSVLPACLQPPSPTTTNPESSGGIFYKSLITFTIPHSQPGSLAIALAVFSTHDFNLTAITTRPSRERNWHYVFFVECEEQRPHRHPTKPNDSLGEDDDDSRLKQMFQDLTKVTERTCLLGSWVDRIRHPCLQ